MTFPEAQKIQGLVASYAGALSGEPHRVGDLGQNAALWIASRLGLNTLANALREGVTQGGGIEDARLAEAPYLAAVGYLVDLGLVLARPSLGLNLDLVLARAPFTREGCGFADDPVRLLGLVLLGQALSRQGAVERLGAVYAEALRGANLDPTRTLFLGLGAEHLGIAGAAPEPRCGQVPAGTMAAREAAAAASLTEAMARARGRPRRPKAGEEALEELLLHVRAGVPSSGWGLQGLLFIAALEYWAREGQRKDGVTERAHGFVPAASAARERPVDIGIVIALREEFRVFREFFGADAMVPERDAELGEYVYVLDLRGYRCVVAHMGEMGGEAAALRTDRLAERRRPKLLANIGIAGGIHPDLHVGDVVVATQIDSYMESVRAEATAEAGGFQLVHGGAAYRADFNLVEPLRQFEFSHPSAYTRWRTRCSSSLREAIEPSTLSPLLANGVLRETPEFADCHLASGPAVAAAEAFAKWVRGRDRNLKAIEMESGGVARAGAQRVAPIPVLALRGISDGANHDKSAYDSIGKGVLRRHAMHNALSLFSALLEERILPVEHRQQA